MPSQGWGREQPEGPKASDGTHLDDRVFDRATYEAGTREQPERRVLDAEYIGLCDRCGSDRWVSVSFTGGLSRVPQCVPCGRVHPGVRLGEQPSREQPAGLREALTVADIETILGEAEWTEVTSLNAKLRRMKAELLASPDQESERA